jgi:hypothetical protein
MYQGTKVPSHRHLRYTNIDLYTIHIASSNLVKEGRTNNAEVGGY